MRFKALTAAVLVCVALAAQGAEQEETFTIAEPGADNVDPNKLSRLLDRNDPRAINNIGWLWARGEGGVKQDFNEALQWWRHAAKLGYTVAMNNLGLLYANGDGVKQDYEKAFEWWMRSAERGNAWAMNAVGDLYENGQGVPQNDELALTWYREAAAEGDPMGMWNIAHLSEAGRGTEQNFGEAMRWYLQAAERGYAPAMHSLGRLYQEGKGARQDLVEAFALYTLAARRFTAEEAGDAEENARLLQEVSARLTPEERNAGMERARTLDLKYRKPIRTKPQDKGSAT
jgi:TPR repeat protein